jgi:hypothetical protein
VHGLQQGFKPTCRARANGQDVTSAGQHEHVELSPCLIIREVWVYPTA